MSHGPQPCTVCAVPLRAAWPFREDDRHCALCGEQILRILPRPVAPDGALWLYHDPYNGFVFHVAAERGVARCPERRRAVRPPLELPRCSAHFGGDLDFALEDLSADGDESATLRLVARFPGIDALALPPEGIAGQIVLATGAGAEVIPARLLPPPRDAALECPDPSVSRAGDLWHVYGQDGGAVVPLRLAAPVAQWALSVSGNVEPGAAPGLSLEGANGAALLEPGRPLHLRLRIEGAGWEPLRPVPFTFVVQRAGLAPLALRGRVALLPGSQLVFEGGQSRAVAVRLGRKAVVSVPLTALDSGLPPLSLGGEGGNLQPQERYPHTPNPSPPRGEESEDDDEVILELEDVDPEAPAWDAEGDGVTVVDYAVEQGPHEVPWLRVLAPRREGLPWDLPPGAVGRLDLEVDTTRLDRERYDGATLRGAVTLLDARQRRWRCEVQAAVSRPPALPAWVAFDWGTTNSCAAFRRGVQPNDSPVSLSFDEEQARAPELFPSDMYFEDLSDPQHPVFCLGHEAARKARARPECCLRSVKRAFQFRDRLFVMDEHQRGHSYGTDELARLLLRRLVALAEDALGQEIHRLGLSFPTKWPARVRHRLERVAAELEAELRRERRPFGVAVLPPELDEANAVAIDFITSEHGRDDLPETFHLIAYDFGGGTIDTSVLEVHLPEDLAAVRTRYVGLGGRGDFGGDDVTRAVLTWLRDRTAEAPQCARVILDGATGRAVRLLGIPLVGAGEPLRAAGPDAAQWHHLGRQNWDILWQIAERLKIHLGNAAAHAPGGIGGTPGDADFGESLAMDVEEEERRRRESEGRHTVRDLLQPQMDRVFCRVVIDPGPGASAAPEEAVWTLAALLDPLDADARDAFFSSLDVTLEEACSYPLEDVFETNGGRRYTVYERVEETVRELRAQCDARGVFPDAIVLAGGGSRLPLVARLFREYFPSDRELLHYGRDHSKRRVAFGMASYLALREALDLDRQLARSSDVIHRALGVRRTVVERRVARVEFEAVAPVGAPLNDPSVAHHFRFSAGQLIVIGGVRRLTLWAHDGRGEREIGHFELAALPVTKGTSYDGELRLRGARRIELTVTHAGHTSGPFPLVPRTADPDDALQGGGPGSAEPA